MRDSEKKAQRIVENIIEDLTVNYRWFTRGWRRLTSQQQEDLAKIWQNLVIMELEDPASIFPYGYTGPKEIRQTQN